MTAEADEAENEDEVNDEVDDEEEEEEEDTVGTSRVRIVMIQVARTYPPRCVKNSANCMIYGVIRL
jgi:hypothetical protein